MPLASLNNVWRNAFLRAYREADRIHKMKYLMVDVSGAGYMTYRDIVVMCRGKAFGKSVGALTLFFEVDQEGVLMCTSQSSLLAVLSFVSWSSLGLHKLNCCWMKLKQKQCFRVTFMCPNL